MTTVLVSAGTALVTLLTVGALVWYVRRRAVSGADRLLTVIDERMGAIARELHGAVEQANAHGGRSQFVTELAGSIDLDEVVSRTLEAAGDLPGVDAAAIALTAADGEPVVEIAGMTREEAEEHALSSPGQAGRLRALTMRYAPAAGEEAAIAAGLAVPIPGELDPIGLLSVYTRSASHSIAELEVELESLALRAGPAIQNARRFREARQLADLDALTSLHNRRYFHETLGREVARAQRYDRRLALILIDLDNFKSVNDRIGHLAGDTVLAEIAERIKEVVRSADIACRVGGDEFAVVLPESTLEDADQLYARLRGAIAARPAALVGPLSVSAGMAELRPEDDPPIFFQRADEALYRAKASGKGRVAAEDAETTRP